ncbi:MAG: hypothetical protein AAFN10_22430 [Bacteroidota bacterium]
MPHKQKGPWNIRGASQEAKEKFGFAAALEGMAIGEWLESVAMAHADEVIAERANGRTRADLPKKPTRGIKP